MHRNPTTDRVLDARYRHTFSSVLEHDINIYNEDIKKFGTFDLCGTTTMYAYMGAVRGGLYRSIEALPTEVRLPVKEYFKRRVQRTSEIVRRMFWKLTFY